MKIVSSRERFRIALTAASCSGVVTLLAGVKTRFDTSGRSVRAVGDSSAKMDIPEAKSVIFGILVFRFGALLVQLPQ